jgi:hypothetical protein
VAVAVGAVLAVPLASTTTDRAICIPSVTHQGENEGKDIPA